MADDRKTITDIMKNPQWRVVAAILLLMFFFYLWSQFFRLGAPQQHPISYSQFMEQLNAGNIKSIIIKELQVSGEFTKEISVQLPAEKKPASVKYFQTFLPTFQGQDLLNKLQEKNVAVTVESPEKGLLWQVVIGVLP